MGCTQSQAVIVQSTKTENSHLHPTIFMVGEKSLQMLRELGELKFYQLAQHNEAEASAENVHHDFAAQLENPLQYFREEQSKCSGNYQLGERSTSNIKRDYSVHSHDLGISNNGLTDQESRNGLNNASGNLPSDSSITTKYTNNSPVFLSTKSLTQSKAMEIKISAKNTSSSPILLSGTSPSHSKAIDKTTAQNLSRSPTHDRTKDTLSPKNLPKELNPKTNAISCLTDPLDEIVSAPDASSTTPTNDGSVTPKTKARTIFGRNRIMPKRDDASDKYGITKSEHESPSHTAVDNS